MRVPASPQLDVSLAFEDPPTPYPGLRSFEMHEWPIFFGRESATKEVVDQLI
jgi:hypothetical protein